jgi:hypothetical protein
MTLSPQELSDSLRTNGEKNVEFIRQIPESVLDLQIYQDGAGWSVRDLLVHLVDAEKYLRILIERIAKGGEGVSEDFDLDDYNGNAVRIAKEREFVWLADEFELLRNQTVEMVAQLTPQNLQEKGRHPFLGMTQVSEMLKLMGLHVQLHLRDIRRLIKSQE